MSAKIKKLQVIQSREEINTDFSPDNVYYIKPLDEIEYYREPFVRMLGENGQYVYLETTVTVYSEEGFLFTGDNFKLCYDRLSSMDREINGVHHYCWKDRRAAFYFLIFTPQLTDGTYPEGSAYRCNYTETDGEITLDGNLNVYNSPYKLTHYYKDEPTAPTELNDSEEVKVHTSNFYIGDGQARLYQLYASKGVKSMWLENCTNLTKVTLNEGVTEISCQNCSSLTYIHVPSTVTFMEEYTFSGCTNLTIIRYDGIAETSNLLHPWGAPNATWSKMA